MLLIDYGTSYCKIFDSSRDERPWIVATKNLDSSLTADLATGHNAKKRARISVNELTALARGGEGMIQDKDFVLLDCGSRDIKFVRYENRKIADMGWNAECGASMGFTIELLGAYYNLDYTELPVPEKASSVTCGVLGMSTIFDDVVAGISETEAVARFVRGIALNGYRFAGSPERLYLSGGLCENPLFVKSLPCEVITLGRFVLLEGLKVIAAERETHA
jgi:activator of 2-hydroxyglutaryl-CoA dehydratase